MNKKTDNIEKSYLCTIIYCIFAILKWSFFALGIISAAFTLGLIVMSIFRFDLITNTMIAKMFGWITFSSEEAALGLVNTNGLLNVQITAIVLGLASTITYGVLYKVFKNFIEILITIITGDMYTKDNVTKLQKLFPYTFVLAFLKPIIITILSDTVGVVSTSDINLSGLVYIFIVYLLKVVFEKGYELEKKTIKISNDLSDYKAREAEFQMEELVKEETIKQLKKTIKSLEPKEEKEPVKKTVSKKSTTAKTTAKKTTTVKAENKKETTKKAAAKKAVKEKKESTKKTTK